MRLRLPSLKIEETVDRLLEEKTGQIVGQVMNEVSGSNFALEIKDMVVDELEPKVKAFAQEALAEYLGQFRDDLIKEASTQLIRLLTEKLLEE